MLNLSGIFPPVPTPFYENEELALGQLQDNIRQLSRHDLSGFLLLGSNGEHAHLSDSEKLKVFEAARDAVPNGKLLLAGTGCQTTRETIALTRAAARAGADAAVVLNPFFFKGQMSPGALLVHYWAVADTAEIPVILYNMPANTGLDMDALTLARIAEHENIIGLKDSGGNLIKLTEIGRMTGSGFQLLAGSASFLLPALSIGAVGGILALANVAPELCLDVYRNFRNGDLENARIIQQRIIALNTAVTSRLGVAALKYAMDQIRYHGGLPRKPLLPLSDSEKKEVLRLLDDAGTK